MIWDSKMPDVRRPKQILLVADGAANTGDVEVAVAASGGFLKARIDPAKALDWLRDGPASDMILVEVDQPTPLWGRLLAEADAYATRTQTPLSITAADGAIDCVAAHAAGPYTQWLCSPDLGERVSAIAVHMAECQPQLRDVATELDTQRLRRLADEVSRIARALSTLSSTERVGESFAATAMSDIGRPFRPQPVDLFEASTLPTADEVRRILRLRRLRDQYFDPSLFADPAWDMLLDLMAARLEEAQVAVSSLCIAAAVPPTTALRWIKAMTDHGLFERCADPDDGRRIFIRLSDRAMTGMGRYFDAAKKVGGVIL